MTPKQNTYQCLMVKKLTTNFKEAVEIQTNEMCNPAKDEVCIKNKYVGINATDINATKGRYFSSKEPPFGVGFEGVGEIVEVGNNVKNVKVGQYVAYLNSHMNSYAEYVCVEAKEVFVIPEAKPEYLVLIVSGLTAAIGLDKAARIMAGETVLITAAAGGTGHIAVQWAKAADCHVIGTCSTAEKKNILKELGCDRIVNYKTEDLNEVLRKEYKDGVNVVWETIGGDVFQTCLQHLAIKGRLVVVGGISGYKNEDEGFLNLDLSNLPQQLVGKSATVQGYLVLNYADCYATYFAYLADIFQKNKLKPIIDDGKHTTGDEFFGMEGIVKGIEHLHSGKSIGKVVVRIS